MQQAIGILFFVLFCGSVRSQNQTKADATLPYYSGVPSGRVVNGQTVSIQSYPFVVGVRVNNGQVCGGSIITAKHVVTAAHCLSNRPAFASVSVHAGSTSQYSGGYFLAISYYVIHPYYNPQITDHDAAIITISASFAGLQNVAVITLQGAEVGSTWCYALGWGSTNGARQASPENLQFTWLQSISTQSCEAQGYGTGRITQQMMCAQYPGHDVCSGDSGGPLVCNSRLTGIASFVAVGCEGKYPAVFGKILSTSIRSFIRQYTGI